MIELDNGCVCCTVRDDLIEAILRILERPKPIDYLIIETTGLADPGPVAMTFLTPQLRPLTRLDGIIGVVDAENFVLDLFNSETAVNQIAFSDIILLNKIDRVSEARRTELTAQIKEIKPEAPVLLTENSQVDLRLILDVGAFKIEQHNEEPAVHVHGPDCGHDHHEHDDHAHEHHDHPPHPPHFEAEGFTSLSIELDEPLIAYKTEVFLKELPTNVFRAKGLLWLKESPEKVIFHLVGSRVRLDYEPWKTAPKTQIVFIGQNLDKEAIRQGLLACLAPKAKPKAKGFRWG
jgi:G3E family GTPase